MLEKKCWSHMVTNLFEHKCADRNELKQKGLWALLFSSWSHLMALETFGLQVLTMVTGSKDSKDSFPTNNALLTNFRLSFDAEILLVSTERACKSAPNVPKACMQCVRSQTELPFCMPLLVVGLWQAVMMNNNKCFYLSASPQVTSFLEGGGPLRP